MVMVNTHNVVITMLRKDFKFLDHLAHTRYDKDVCEPLDDAMVYESKEDRNVVHVVFEDFPWDLSNPCVQLIESYLKNVPHHIAVMEVDTGFLEVGKNSLDEDDTFSSSLVPNLDSLFWRFDDLPMSNKEMHE
jgi:hypothetical protein